MTLRTNALAACAAAASAVLLGRPRVEPPRLHLPYFRSPPAHAGFPSPAADYVEDALDLHELMVSNPPATFYVRVRGHSLVDLGIHDKDVLVVDRSLDALVGRIVVAIVDGSLFVKVLRMHQGRLALMSANAAEGDRYRPIYLDSVQDHAIWGVVTGVVRKL